MDLTDYLVQLRNRSRTGTSNMIDGCGGESAAAAGPHPPLTRSPSRVAITDCSQLGLQTCTPARLLNASPPKGEGLADYELGGVDCPECGNTGMISYIGENGELVSRQCACMKKRVALRRIRQSGMSDLLSRYSFETYKDEAEEQKNILAKAKQFAGSDEGWFYIFGRSGSGKSHICTAICGELINRNRDVYYMPWRDESTQLKSLIMDSFEYERRTQKLKRVEVLYIDDFLKGGDTDADIRLAYEILNFRYNDIKLRTILSSETDLKTLLKRDEALGGRVYERARGYVLQAPASNMRFQAR